VAKVCPHSKRSLERWVAVYKRGGEKALEPKATIPRTSPQETPIWIKEILLAEGEGKYWNIKKGSHNSNIYTLILKDG